MKKAILTGLLAAATALPTFANASFMEHTSNKRPTLERTVSGKLDGMSEWARKNHENFDSRCAWN